MRYVNLNTRRCLNCRYKESGRLERESVRHKQVFVNVLPLLVHLLGDRGSTVFNPLTSNDLYRGRTAPLTSKVAFYIFIQQI